MMSRNTKDTTFLVENCMVTPDSNFWVTNKVVPVHILSSVGLFCLVTKANLEMKHCPDLTDMPGEGSNALEACECSNIASRDCRVHVL